MRIDILSAVPDIFRSPLEASILKRAQTKDLVTITVHNLHDWAFKGHIDDYPYGGGAGMVIRVDVAVAAIRHLTAQYGPYDEIIYLTADGERLSQPILNQLSLKKRLLLLAGHYKGIDDRIRAYITREISIGDYVLTGGELPALVLLDGIVRLLPGALGDMASALEDSFQDGLLSAPIYTRPRIFEGQSVPPVLMSGHHEAIADWRWAERSRRTAERRPDLFNLYLRSSPPLTHASASEAPLRTGAPLSAVEEPSLSAHDNSDESPPPPPTDESTTHSHYPSKPEP